MTEVLENSLNVLNPSEVEREAIERAITVGHIDPADYEAAHLRYVQCMNQQGFWPEFREATYGVYIELPYAYSGDQNELDQAHSECSQDNAVLASLYLMQQANPDLWADPQLVAVQCLRKGSFVDVDYTVEDFAQDWAKSKFPFDRYADGPNDCLYGAGYGYAFFSASGQ